MEIKLAPFGKQHLEISRRWMNDREICRLFGRVYKQLTSAEQEKWYAKVRKDLTQLIFAIEADKTYVGNAGLKYINNIDSKAEYYIFIGDKNYWGKGIGTAATIKLLDYVKKNLKLHKIYLHVDSDNLAAIKLYKKIGFIEEGILKDEVKRENKYRTIIRMAYFLSYDKIRR